MTNMTDTTPTPTPETVKRYEPCFDMEHQGYFMLQDGERVEAYEKVFVDESDYALMESRALAAEAKAPKWQPMETAPRDGREILAVGRVGNPYVVVCRNGKNEWYMQEADCYRDPVAWMPLPTPPMKEGE